MTLRLPSMLSPSDLPEAELCAARLDGDLFAIGGGFSPVDLPELSSSRARSLLPQVGRRLIVELLTAAWIFGASPAAPAVHQLCSAADARARPAIGRGLAVREVVIDDDELVVIGGVRVTSPLRTACDLVRSQARFDAPMQLVVLQLLDLTGASLGDCIELLDRRRNLPGKRRTLQRLRLLAATQPLLTR